MKKNIIRLILVLGISLLGIFLLKEASSNKIQTISVNGQRFQAEIVSTQSKLALGLGGRDSLCAECGMIFVFSQKDKHPFWMKGMRIPLDIIWFDSAGGRIVHIEKNIPADSKEIYSSPEKANRVLEINAGLADRYGIKVGDSVKLEK